MVLKLLLYYKIHFKGKFWNDFLFNIFLPCSFQNASAVGEQLKNITVAISQLTSSIATGAASVTAGNPETNAKTMQDLAMLQATLFSLQQQQLLQMQILSQMQQQKQQSEQNKKDEESNGGPPTSIAELAKKMELQNTLVPRDMQELLQKKKIDEPAKISSAPRRESSHSSHLGIPLPSSLSGNKSSEANKLNLASATNGSSSSANDSLSLRSQILDPNAPSSLSSSIIIHHDSPGDEKPVNSLELLQQRAQGILNNASQGLLANNLADFSVGKEQYDKKGEPFFKHRCRYCGKVFGSDSALQIHVRSHTGERPYKCNVCGNRFTTKGNLKVHFQRHSSKFPNIKMNPNLVPEHLDKFYPPLLQQIEEAEKKGLPLPSVNNPMAGMTPVFPPGFKLPNLPGMPPISLAPTSPLLGPPPPPQLSLPRFPMPTNHPFPKFSLPTEPLRREDTAHSLISRSRSHSRSRSPSPSMNHDVEIVDDDDDDDNNINEEEEKDAGVNERKRQRSVDNNNIDVESEDDDRRSAEILKIPRRHPMSSSPAPDNDNDDDDDNIAEDRRRHRSHNFSMDEKNLSGQDEPENLSKSNNRDSSVERDRRHSSVSPPPASFLNKDLPRGLPVHPMDLAHARDSPFRFLPGGPIFPPGVLPGSPLMPPGLSLPLNIPNSFDPAKDPNIYTNLLPRPGSNDNAWESLIEVSKASETSKLEQLVNNIENKLSDPNECVICHRVLSCKSALQMHYRTHTGERPFKCRICGRAFTTKGNLKTHMGVHRAKPPMRMFHQCPVCHKKYANALVLQQHIRTHTGEPTELTQEQINAAEIRDFPPFPFPPGGMGASPFGLGRLRPGGPHHPLFPGMPSHLPSGFGNSPSPDMADHESNDDKDDDPSRPSSVSSTTSSSMMNAGFPSSNSGANPTTLSSLEQFVRTSESLSFLSDRHFGLLRPSFQMDKPILPEDLSSPGRKADNSTPPPRSGMNGRSKINEGDDEDSPVSPPKFSASEPKSNSKRALQRDEDEDIDDNSDRPKTSGSPAPNAGDRNIPSPQSSTGSTPRATAGLDLAPRGGLLFPGFPGLLQGSHGFPNHLLAAAAAASGGGGSPSPSLSQLSAFANSPFNPLGLPLPMRRKSKTKIIDLLF